MEYTCKICGKLFSSQKSLRNHAPYHKVNISPFYFFIDIGQYTGDYAISLMDFYNELQNIDVKSINFHMDHYDFQHWIRDIGGFTSLVHDLNQLAKRRLQNEALRSRLLVLLQRALQVSA